MPSRRDPPFESDATSLTDRQLRRVLASLRDVLVLTDERMLITYVSPSIEPVLGHRPADLIGRSILDVLHPDERPIAEAHLANRFADHTGRTLTHRTLHGDGSVRYFESMIDVIEEAGDFRGAVFNTRDVTERVSERARLEREVGFSRSLVGLTNELLSARLDERFQQHALERAIALVPDAQGGSMLLYDPSDDRFVYAAAVGYDLDALRSVRLSATELARSVPPQVERIVVGAGAHGVDASRLHVLRDAGRLDTICMTLSVPIVLGGEVRGYLNLDNFEDPDAFDGDARSVADAISSQVAVALQRLTLERDLQRERARYEILATHDALTGLPNRRLFQDRLERALAYARREGQAVAVLYLDLDGFKAVNDEKGHDVGDALLQAVAQRLDATVRREDTVARLGGDEFGVVLMSVRQPEDALDVGRKLRAALQEPLDVNGTPVPLGASVGVAVYPSDGVTADALMRAADGAMYAVKAGGKGGVRHARDTALADAYPDPPSADR
jgi:diguanylate cyclase (GGDEF)-like protein/PAS domain S-box-containing protein